MSIDYENLMESFVAESTELLDRAEGSILDLEQGFNKDVVNDIFRAFHTIKGDSGIFGLQHITGTFKVEVQHPGKLRRGCASPIPS